MQKEIKSLEAHLWYLESVVTTQGFKTSEKDTILSEIIETLEESIIKEKEELNDIFKSLYADKDQDKETW